MKTWLRLIFLTLALLATAWSPAGAGDPFQEAEKILGRKGQLAEGAWLVRFPRSDLKITINGSPYPPPWALSGGRPSPTWGATPW